MKITLSAVVTILLATTAIVAASQEPKIYVSTSCTKDYHRLANIVNSEKPENKKASQIAYRGYTKYCTMLSNGSIKDKETFKKANAAVEMYRTTIEIIRLHRDKK